MIHRVNINVQITGKQCITTFTIDVNPGGTGQGPGWTLLLQSMARVGKGLYFTASDAATFTQALQKIFNQIQAVNSVFALKERTPCRPGCCT